ncbi:hypothetical protein F66182_10038 [Fusarium sp. NRRL 66182]|nr:hypothetical protein F66182_10038 [Fusarium sp. NRRL 66182]
MQSSSSSSPGGHTIPAVSGDLQQQPWKSNQAEHACTVLVHVSEFICFKTLIGRHGKPSDLSRDHEMQSIDEIAFQQYFRSNVFSFLCFEFRHLSSFHIRFLFSTSLDAIPESMSNTMGTDSPAGIDSKGNGASTTPQKPSQGILDRGQMSTGQENLSEDITFLYLGTGTSQDQHFSASSEIEIDHHLMLEGYDGPHQESSLLAPTSLELPTTTSHPSLSSSDVSETGVSFSLPTTSLISASVAGNEVPVQPSSSNYRGPMLFTRMHEFSWQHSELCFAGEPFNVAGPSMGEHSNADKGFETTPRTLSDSSASGDVNFNYLQDSSGFGVSIIAGIGSFGDTVKPWMERSHLDNLDATPTTRLISSNDSEEEHSFHGRDPVRAVLAREENINWIVKLLLDDYFRSYAPQRSQKRNQTARNSDPYGTGDGPGMSIADSGTKATGEARSRIQKKVGGFEDKDDEDSGGDEQQGCGHVRLRNSRTWACPFQKWDPTRYICKPRLIQISYVKAHLKKWHKYDYCHKCFQILEKGSDHELHCRNYATVASAPAHLITDEKWEVISRYSKRNTSKEEHWWTIYEALFPGERPSFTPYLSDAEEEQIRRGEGYLQSHQAQNLVQIELEDNDFAGQRHVEVVDEVHDRFLARMFWHCRDGSSLNELPPAGESYQESGHSDSTLTIDPRKLATNSLETVAIQGFEAATTPTASQDYFGTTGVEYMCTPEPDDLGQLLDVNLPVQI